MRALVLGSSGFVGGHVVREFLSRGADVVGVSRRGETRAEPRAKPSTEPHVEGRATARFTAIRVDLRDAAACRELAAPNSANVFVAAPFDAVVLLSGHAVPGVDFDERLADENRAIARNALDLVSRTSPGTRVVVTSSAHVYGTNGDAEPLREDRALAPAGAYGRSKVDVEVIAREHAAHLAIVTARAFHLIGPGMPAGLLVPDLLAALRADVDPISMRGADGLRDFLDVRDGARALVDLAVSAFETPTVVNVCSGRGTRVSDVARGLIARSGHSRDLRFAPGSPLPLVGSNERLRRLVRFEPRHDLDATLDWIWRERA